MLEKPAPEYADVPVLIERRPSTYPIPLDRVLERQRYPPMLTAIAVLILAFVLFQVIVSPLVVVLGLLMQGIPASELPSALATMVENQLNLLLIGNTVGQVLGLAVPAVLVARMHSSDWRDFLRLRGSTGLAIGLGLLGLAALMPTVQWLGSVNQILPLPPFLKALEEAQNDMIEKVLLQRGEIWFTLLTLALTPAICEEILFRGYVQRQAERGLGVAGGILFAGIMFGLYHLRPTQILPLSVLGLYLAFLCWSTGSLLPAMVVHFANNAFAVILAAYVRARPDLDPSVIEQFDVPWYYIVLGLVIFIPVAGWFLRAPGAEEPGARPYGPREINLPIE